jgi:glycosyltransferase involved in cell wall biosynthesis
MRVVFVTHNYPRFPGDLAGSFLHPLARALVGRGHELVVVAPSEAGRNGRDVLDGIPVARVRYASPGRERYAYTGRMGEALRTPAGWLALVRLLRALRVAVRSEAAGPGATVVHAHWWIPAGLAAPPEVPCVVTLHGTDARWLTAPGAAVLARRALRPPRVLTAVSRSVAARAAAATGRPIDDAHVGPMPVTGPARPSRGGRGLVFVGRLTDQKRVELAIGAFAALDPRRAPSLTIVGDGPARTRLEDLSRRLGVDGRVRFVGRVAADAVRDHLTDADGFVFPARAEGFGLSVIEALLAGVPVVACRDGGGVADVLDAGGGLLVDPTTEAVGQGMTAVLADPDFRRRAHAAGLEWEKGLAPERVAGRYEAWYHEALRG